MVSGRKCRIRCDKGYALEGSETAAVLTCEAGRWSGEAKCTRSWFKSIKAAVVGSSTPAQGSAASRTLGAAASDAATSGAMGAATVSLFYLHFVRILLTI